MILGKYCHSFQLLQLTGDNAVAISCTVKIHTENIAGLVLDSYLLCIFECLEFIKIIFLAGSDIVGKEGTEIFF